MGNRCHIIFWFPHSRKLITEVTPLTMADNKSIFAGLLLLCNLALGLTDDSCYRIEPGTVAGIICADVVLTLIIVIVTYRCASFRRQKLDNADKVYMNVRANCKS